MSSIQERLQLKRVPLDTWNIREQLCLASAVVRSGDQNWMSVSRALKTVAEPNRPPDWYSQKSCAAQYGALLENVETPKRKKRNSEGAVETPQESILKKLTQERIVEIQKTIAEMNQQYEQLKNEITEVRNPVISEDRLREIWTSLEAANRAKERDTARRTAWLKEREERKARVDRTWRPPQPTTPTSPVAPTTPSSPLLTSLLKSSPVVTTPQHISHPANVVDTMSPSVTAPTLSMLLEKSAASSQHESKHAAIEHIKSQLVQIEQQLKASVAPGAAPLAPAVDIDDIEIKAEDVYAFRDIDIHLPPVAAMHKGNNRTADKTPTKKDESELNTNSSVVEPPPPAPEVIEDIVEEKPIIVDQVEEVTPHLVETPSEEPSDEAPTAPMTREPTPDAEVKIAFPEVKFPTTEIKVIQPDDQKIKEEVKDPEVSVEPDIQDEEIRVQEDVDISIDDIGEQPQASVEAVVEQPEVEKPIETEDVPVTETVDEAPNPESIPLPPEPNPEDQVAEEQVDEEKPPLPPESEPVPHQETTQQIKQEREDLEDTEQSNVEVTSGEERVEDLEDIKKEEDAEDLIPLKQMVREEAGRGAEGRPPEDARAERRPPEDARAEKRPPEDARAERRPPEDARAEKRPPEDVRAERRPPEDARVETDDDTPMELSREEEKDGKKRRDYSRKKKSDSRTCSGSESAAEASAPDSPSANDAERQHRLWKKSVMLVYSRLCAHKYASLFLRPISDEEAPGYSIVVKRPMDLTTIRRNIENGQIRTTAQFQRDVLLMLSNALMYNSSEHSVYTMAREMHEEAASQLGMLLAAQAHAGLSEPPPQRRKRRRPDSPRVYTKRHL